jgi:glutaconate CoA-transferase subunit B
MLSSFVDMLGTVLHRGPVDVGFLGGLEVDAYGNVNTTLLGDPKGAFRHFVGSGGANDIASLARETIIIIRHEARKLKEAIAHITSPGYLSGGDSGREAGVSGVLVG